MHTFQVFPGCKGCGNVKICLHRFPNTTRLQICLLFCTKWAQDDKNVHFAKGKKGHDRKLIVLSSLDLFHMFLSWLHFLASLYDPVMISSVVTCLTFTFLLVLCICCWPQLTWWWISSVVWFCTKWPQDDPVKVVWCLCFQMTKYTFPHGQIYFSIWPNIVCAGLHVSKLLV